MVRILTKDFTELDLTKGFEFQIEMENPMLEEDHIPSAFSTQISFPPSPVNRRVFGYTPAMFLAPNVKRLEASVWIGGVPFVSGTLVYDGIEDGCLMYTFTEKVVELEGKIWDQEILEFVANSEFSVPESNAEKFTTPLLINKANVAMQPYSKASREPIEGEPDYGAFNEDDLLYRQKYFNYESSSEDLRYRTFIPAIPLRTILAGVPVKIPDGLLLRNGWAELSILGRYHEFLFDDVVKNRWVDAARRPIGTNVSGGRKSNTVTNGRITQRPDGKTDIASFLPDISFAELIKNLCRIFCAAVFYDNGSPSLILNTETLEREALDWSDKISDEFTSEEEAAMSYKFGFADDESGMSSTELEKALKNGSVEESEAGLNYIPNFLKQFTTKDEYTVMYDKTTGDVYSGKQYTAIIRKYYNTGDGSILLDTDTAYECDVVFQDSKPIESLVDGEETDVFDNSSDFYLARCAPEMIITSDSGRSYKMAAIVQANAAGEDRDNKVYLGVSYYNQFFSNGYFQILSQMDALFLGSESLVPDALWDKYHKAFAEWLGKTRQRVSVDVNLSPIDLHNFRLYRPVYFKGRKWIVAKLSVTVAAGSEAVSTRGEFIEI